MQVYFGTPRRRLAQVIPVIGWVPVVINFLAPSCNLVRASTLSREAASSEPRWRTLLEDVELVVLGLDPDSRVNDLTTRQERLTGFEAGRMLGQPIQDLLETSGPEVEAFAFGEAFAMRDRSLTSGCACFDDSLPPSAGPPAPASVPAL